MLLSCSFFSEAFKIVVLSDCIMGRKWVYRVSTDSHSQKGLELARTKCPVYPVYAEWKAGSTLGHLPDRYPTEPRHLP